LKRGNRRKVEGDQVTAGLGKLMHYIETEGYSGYDPYDALNSPLLRTFSLGRKYPRIFFTQFLKGLPVNLRPVLGIRKGLNPKALGLFLWGYSRLHSLEEGVSYLPALEELLDHLEETRSQGCTGNGWGYNFHWQSRAFYVPRYTPTVVNSSFIGHALLDCHRLTGSERALSLALPIKDYILGDLNRTEDEDSLCFSYTSLDHLTVHNANLLGASLLMRIHRYSGEAVTRETALSAMRYSMKRQREDGSWYYADAPSQKWIDSFHTGFTLQSLWYFLQEGVAENYRPRLEKGIEYYRDNFFLEDGKPKYYHNRLYPIDIHSSSQAVVLFSMLGGEYRPLTELVLGWMMENMQDESGYFYFRKYRRHTNRIPYMRWSQAWAFHALTAYLEGDRDRS
jgi:hypothetical protein